MGVRTENKIEITACVPLIAKFVKSESDYFKKLNEIEKIILNISNANFPNSEIKIFLNTRDNPETNDFYLTAIGSAIESGDEGAVGRGNRSNGTISFTRNMSLEAACGKNPIYHTGKLYSAIGNEISKEIYNTFGIENTIYLTSKMLGILVKMVNKRN